MKRHLWLISTVMLTTALAGVARAQAPAGAPPAVPSDPVPASPPPVATTAAGGAEDVAAGFGMLGQIAISGELQASFTHESTSSPGGGGSSSINVVSFQPALDYFVAPNVSVGGALVITHGDSGSGSGSETAVGILARAGYNLHLAPIVSFWPQLAIGYLHDSFSGGGASGSGYSVPLQLFAPILVHVTTHLFVGIGPAFSTDLLSKVEGMDAGKITDIGISSVVGGYFGG